MTRTAARRATALSVWSTIALALACQSPPARTPDIDLRALEPRLAKRIQERLAAVNLRPTSAETWGRLGMVLDVHDIRKEAAYCYEQAQTLDDEDFRWPYFLGVLKLMSHQGESLGHFLGASELIDDYAPLFIYIGGGHLLNEELEKATDAFHRALEIDADFYRARLGLAKVALARGAPETARALLDTALAQGAAEGEVHWLLAEAYRRLGNEAAAQRHFQWAQPLKLLEPMSDSLRVAIRREEGVTLALIQQRTDHLLRQGQVGTAIEQWQQVLAEDPHSVDVLAQLGRALAMSGQLEEAVSTFTKALELDPSHLNAQTLLGDARLQQRKIELAVSAYERAVQIDPGHDRARYKLGTTLLIVGRQEEGLDQLRQAILALREDLEAQLHFTTTVTRLGHHHEVVDSYRRALEHFPGNAHLQNGLAWLLATSPHDDLRDGEQALAWAQRAAQRSQNAQTLETLAAAHAEVGDFRSAVEVATRAKELLLKAGNFPAVGQLEQRLKRYRSQQPYRHPPP